MRILVSTFERQYVSLLLRYQKNIKLLILNRNVSDVAFYKNIH